MKELELNQKYTLSSDYVLRSNKKGYTLFHSPSSYRYELSSGLFLILKIFRNNALSLNELIEYLKINNINLTTDIIINLFKEFPMEEVLSSSNYPYGKSHAYNHHLENSIIEYTPERIDWVISERCNLACKHCLQNSSPLLKQSEIDLIKLEGIFAEMEELNLEAMKITGGEPLYAKNAKLIFKMLSGRHFEKLILTNGILIDDDWIDIFRNDKSFHLSISLDGANNTSHDYIRGKGAFVKTIENAKRMTQAGVFAAYTVTVNTHNKDELEQIADFAINKLSARSVIFSFLRPVGRAQQNRALHLSKEDMQKTENKFKFIERCYGDKIVISDDSNLSKNESKSIYNEHSTLTCAAGTSIFAMDSNFNVYPCTYGISKNNLIIGNLNKSRIFEIWNSPAWATYRGGITLGEIEGCSICRFASRCSLKQCRLKPLSAGKDFYSHVDYCHASKVNNAV
jgi:radical SAM protein with 4Fe4S-binding SPASM domain